MTKTTTASVRIALSHNYSTFEVIMNLDNENGISAGEIETTRKECQALAQNALNDYKAQPIMNPKQELEKVEKKLAEIQNHLKTKDDPDAIAAVEALPMYNEVKKAKGK